MEYPATLSKPSAVNMVIQIAKNKLIIVPIFVNNTAGFPPIIEKAIPLTIIFIAIKIEIYAFIEHNCLKVTIDLGSNVVKKNKKGFQSKNP